MHREKENIDRNMIINEDKNERLREQLTEYIRAIQPRMELASLSKKSKNDPIRYDPHVSIPIKLKQLLRQWRTMPEEKALQLTANQLYDSYMAFLEIVAWINEQFIFVPTKIEFCGYACISITAYNRLLVEAPADVRQQIADIDADIIDLTEKSSEAGFIKNARFRLASKETGHSVRQVSPIDSLVDKVPLLAPYQLERQLAELVQKHEKD